MQKLGFQRKHKGVKLPEYKTLGASGMDICADILSEDINSTSEKAIKAGEIVKIDTGLYPEIPEGYELQIRPRSGLAIKQGLTVLNSTGTIDSDFKGEIGVILINHSRTTQVITHGQRIAQLVFAKVDKPAIIVEPQELTETQRGVQGYGSTGI